MSCRRDLERMIREYRHVGWEITRTKGSHWKWVSPDGKVIVYSSGSPSDYRALRKHQGELKRAQARARDAMSQSKLIGA